VGHGPTKTTLARNVGESDGSDPLNVCARLGSKDGSHFGW